MKSWLISYAHDPTMHAQTMEQIYEMEEKPFTSSLSICPKARNIKRPCSHLILDTSFKDEVTGILYLGVSFMDNKEQTAVLFCSVRGADRELL
jgi:hypothetical protein